MARIRFFVGAWMRSLCVGLCLAMGAATAGAQPASPPVVKACGHHDYPPWNWHRNDEIVGACAAIARRAIERLGYKVDLSYVGPWKRCQLMVESGEVDVNICAFRNPEREAKSVIVEPRMAQNRIAVFVRDGGRAPGHFSTWADLKGLRTGLIGGVSMGGDFDTFLEKNTLVERAPDLNSVLRMLDRDRVDIAPFGLEAGRLAIDRLGLGQRLVPLAQPALVGDLYIILAKRSPLAAHAKEIGRYLERPEYALELEKTLAEYSRQYLQAAQPAAR
jgi:polar amino acid transport system substrate-binding protein